MSPSSGSLIDGYSHVTFAVVCLSPAIIGEVVVNTAGCLIVGGLFGGSFLAIRPFCKEFYKEYYNQFPNSLKI